MKRENEMNVISNPRSGCERFLWLRVIESGEPAKLDPDVLDRKGKNVVAGYMEYPAVAARVEIRWRSSEDRESCWVDQTARGRWRRVEELKSVIENECTVPPPVFLSPTLTSLRGYKLVDGARRIMAAAEVGKAELPCIVVSLRPTSSD